MTLELSFALLIYKKHMQSLSDQDTDRCVTTLNIKSAKINWDHVEEPAFFFLLTYEVGLYLAYSVQSVPGTWKIHAQESKSAVTGFGMWRGKKKASQKASSQRVQKALTVV